jgi:tRNA pseudouridine38-40 synthase
MMPRYLVRLEYKGTDFHGFQKQQGVPTIQGALDSAVLAFTGEEVHSLGAGRTDAGVHALAQAAAFDLSRKLEVGRALKSVNALLPPGIAVTDMRQVPEAFDPRRDAAWREYRYFILNRACPSPLLAELAFHLAGRVDWGLAQKALALVVGEHNFSAFRVKAEEDTTLRTVLECELSLPDFPAGLVCMRVRADAFLYKMVRILAGAVVAVGCGRMSLEELEGHLGGGTRPCAEPLPAHGLYLWEVAYPEKKMEARGRRAD